MRLKAIILQSNMKIYQLQNENFDKETDTTTSKNIISSFIGNSLHGESQNFRNIDGMNTGETFEALKSISEQIIDVNSLSEQAVNNIVKRNLANSILLIILIIITMITIKFIISL